MIAPLQSSRVAPTAAPARGDGSATAAVSIIIPASLRASSASASSLSPPPPRANSPPPLSRQKASPPHSPGDRNRGASASAGARTRFYDPEDLTVEPSSGELALKPLRRVPLEFGKRIAERAKPTFYEIIASAGRPPSSSGRRPASSSSPSSFSSAVALALAAGEGSGAANQQDILAGVFSPVTADRRAMGAGMSPSIAAVDETSVRIGSSAGRQRNGGGARLANIRSEPNLLLRASRSHGSPGHIRSGESRKQA
jgi:hypothetical protein